MAEYSKINESDTEMSNLQYLLLLRPGVISSNDSSRVTFSNLSMPYFRILH